jgi:hypothetical protein
MVSVCYWYVVKEFVPKGIDTKAFVQKEGMENVIAFGIRGMMY